ncbi:MAG: hypothetical protein WCT43_01485 [Candidatus Magasanikbacteria bacterium]
MKKKFNDKYLLASREAIREEYRQTIIKLQNKLFRDRALDFITKEVQRHSLCVIDLVVADYRTKIFTALAKSLGAGAKFKCLKANLRLDQGQKILHVQEIAFSKKCLEEVRERIFTRKFAPSTPQLVPISVCIVSSATAIEIEGTPVVSINHGCPCCGTKV